MAKPDDPSGRSSEHSPAPPDVGVATWMLAIALGTVALGVLYSIL